MTLVAFLEIVGMAVVSALGAVGIFEVLHRIEKHKSKPTSQQQPSANEPRGIVMPTAR